MLALFTNRLLILSISFVLLLASFPLVSVGTTSGPPLIWWLGAAAIIVGGLLPPSRRFAESEDEDAD